MLWLAEICAENEKILWSGGMEMNKIIHCKIHLYCSPHLKCLQIVQRFNLG